jgi:hypothetical protein
MAVHDCASSEKEEEIKGNELADPYQLREGDRVFVHWSDEDEWRKGRISTIFDEIDGSLTLNVTYEDKDKKVVTHRNFEKCKFELLERQHESVRKSCHQRRCADCPMCIQKCEDDDEGLNSILNDFKSLGRLIGLALIRKINFGIRFSNSFCDLLLRGGVREDDDTITDEEIIEYDKIFFEKKVKYIRENDVEFLCMDFTDVLDDRLACDRIKGSESRVPLIPDGEAVDVTNKNKTEYLNRVLKWRLVTSLQLQTRAILQGLYTIVTRETMDRLADLVSAQDFSNLLSGEPQINVDDWERNTKYGGGFTKDSNEVRWFWKVIREFNLEEREKILHFATGSRRPPVGGFAYLLGFAGGLHKFTLHCVKAEKNMNRLPTAHACICTIDMPAYPSLECLRERLRVVLVHGSKGFDQEEEDDDNGGNDDGDNDRNDDDEEIDDGSSSRSVISSGDEEKIWEALD